MKKEMLKDSIISIIMMTVYCIGRYILISKFDPSGTYKGIAGLIEVRNALVTYKFVTLCCNVIGIALVIILIANLIIDVWVYWKESC